MYAEGRKRVGEKGQKEIERERERDRERGGMSLLA